MKAFAAAAMVVLLAGCGGGSSPPRAASAPAGPCEPPSVHHTPYPGHGKGLDGLPWISGQPADAGLVGLIWYSSPHWGRVRDARIWAGGKAPDGANTKILWVFLGRDAPDRAGPILHVSGRRMDGPGRFIDSFPGVGYEGAEGAPSYASIVDIPRPGCWRLTLTTGSVRATVDMHAVRPPELASSAERSRPRKGHESRSPL
jgi:hypothetical protein